MDCLDCTTYLTCRIEHKGRDFKCGKFKQRELRDLYALIASDHDRLEFDQDQVIDDSDELDLEAKKQSSGPIFANDKTDIVKIIDDVLASDLLTPIDTKIDDQTIPLASNFYEFTTGQHFLNIKPFIFQMLYAVQLFGEYCPRCSDIYWMNQGVTPQDSLATFAERVVLLDNGVCPNCGVTRSTLLNNDELDPYQELCLAESQLVFCESGIKSLGQLDAESELVIDRHGTPCSFTKHAATEKPVQTYKTRSGYQLTATPDHKVWTLDLNLNQRWMSIGHVDQQFVGLTIRKPVQDYQIKIQNPNQDQLTKLARLLGFMRKDYSVLRSHVQSELSEVKELCDALNLSFSHHEQVLTITGITELCQSLSLELGESDQTQIHIPPFILNQARLHWPYLQAVFSTAALYKDTAIIYGSPTYLSEVQTLLAYQGIKSAIDHFGSHLWVTRSLLPEEFNFCDRFNLTPHAIPSTPVGHLIEQCIRRTFNERRANLSSLVGNEFYDDDGSLIIINDRLQLDALLSCIQWTASAYQNRDRCLFRMLSYLAYISQDLYQKIREVLTSSLDFEPISQRSELFLSQVHDLSVNGDPSFQAQGFLVHNCGLAGQRCLTPDSLIATVNGWLPISAVLPLDLDYGYTDFALHVFTHTGVSQTSRVFRTKPEPIYRITLDSGLWIEGTADHPLFCQSGFKILANCLNQTVPIIYGKDCWGQNVISEQQIHDFLDSGLNPFPLWLMTADYASVLLFLTNYASKHARINEFSITLSCTKETARHLMIWLSQFYIDCDYRLNSNGSPYLKISERSLGLFISLFVPNLSDIPLPIDPVLERQSKIIDVTVIDDAETYDFQVPGTSTFFANNMLNHNSGKSALVAMCSSYLVHRQLKLQKPNEVYGLLPSNVLHGTFVALTFKQASETLWEPFLAYMTDSPWFCVDQETEVELGLDNQTKKIKSLQPGDLVKTQNGVHPVVRLYDNGVQDCLNLTLANGQSLTATPQHRVMCIVDDTLQYKTLAELTDHDYVVINEDSVQN